MTEAAQRDEQLLRLLDRAPLVEFTVDEQQGTVTCPAGRTVALSRTRVATFGVLCRDCTLRAQCTTCKTGRKLVLHPRDDLLRQARPSGPRPPGCARTT